MIKERSDRIEEYKDRISDLKKNLKTNGNKLKIKKNMLTNLKTNCSRTFKRDQYLNTLTNAENNLSDQRQILNHLKKRSIIVKKAETVIEEKIL